MAEKPFEDAFASAARDFSGPLRLPARESPAPPAPVVDSPRPPAAPAAPAAPAGKLDPHVLHQACRQQQQAVRALAHRAVAEMELWRSRVGTRQVEDLFLYQATFLDVVKRNAAANDKLLAFARASAAATAKWSSALLAANAALAPLSSGEALLAPAGGTGEGAGGGAATPALSLLSAAAADVTAQVATMAAELAASVTRVVVGEDAGVLGRGGASAAGAVAGSAGGGPYGALPQPPGDLVGTCAWYASCAKELREKSEELGGSLADAQGAAERAFAELEALIAAHLSGDPRRIREVKGRDTWLAELRYRRACRALLGVKSRYLAHMAALFERFRAVERARAPAVGACMEAYSALLVRAFDRTVAVNKLPEAARGMNTHGDLCKQVDAEARAKVLAARRGSGGGSGGGGVEATAAAVPAGSPYATYTETATSTARAGGGDGARLTYTLDPAPAVISPFASPLVVRCGPLQRQGGTVGINLSWRPVVAVLTRDAHLHLFSPDEDLATHPDVAIALFRSSAVGFGGTSRELYDLASRPAGGGGGNTLPPPALPASLVQYAAAHAARIDDMATAATSTPVPDLADPLALSRRAGAAPGHTYALSPATKTFLLPHLHACAFEVGESGSGFFTTGGWKAVLKAGSETDMKEWLNAIAQLLETNTFA